MHFNNYYMEYLKDQERILLSKIDDLQWKIMKYNRQLETVRRRLKNPRHLLLYDTLENHFIVELCLDYLLHGWCNKHGEIIGLCADCYVGAHWKLVNEIKFCPKSIISSIESSLTGEDLDLYKYWDVHDILFTPIRGLVDKYEVIIIPPGSSSLSLIITNKRPFIEFNICENYVKKLLL